MPLAAAEHDGHRLYSAMIWLWFGFLAFVAVLIVLHRKWSTPNTRSAARWSAASLVLGLSFAGFVYLTYEHAWFGATLVEPSQRPGADALTMFLSAYLLEGALSVDSLFVFALVFRARGVPTTSQRYWLPWALVCSVAVRLITLAAGGWVMNAFNSLFYVLGGFNLYQGLKLLISRSEDEIEDEDQDGIRDCAMRILRPFGPIVRGDHGSKFFVVHNGGRAVTAGAFCLVSIVLVDFMFALDSLSVISVSKTIFIVVTSNVLAIIALQSLYFILASRVLDSRYSRIGVGGVLVIIGAKMLVQGHVHVPHAVLLALIAGAIGIGVTGSCLDAHGTSE